MTAGKLLGIDLGTTFSAIATLDEHGRAVTLPNVEGEMLTPSAILLEEGSAVVGQAARDVALEQPGKVAQIVKRFMGHPKVGYLVGGKEFRPETLSAILLKKLVLDAERRIGPVTKAVITVPAYFDDTRRKATKDAGRIAGLDIVDILDEPTAAALAYSFHSGGIAEQDGIAEQTVLVYDLGGGTFDVSLVRLSPHRFQSLAIEGDVRLGGKDWDDRIVDFIATKFLTHNGADPRGDAVSLSALQQASERAKRTLSKVQQTSVTCSHAGKMMTVPLSRADFENLTKDLLIRTRLTTQQVLREAKLDWKQVDRVLLVGGSTHMPMTGRMLQEISGRPPDTSLAVSEVVARGAALHAGIIASHHDANEGGEVVDLLGDVVEINVNSHSLGIEIKIDGARHNDVLVPKNTQLPTSATRVYKTLVENQPRVRVKVLQGETRHAEACISIGECWIEGLPRALPKGSPVEVTCSVGSNGLVDVVAKDLTSGKAARAEIHRVTGLSDEEIAREAAWVRSLDIQ